MTVKIELYVADDVYRGLVMVADACSVMSEARAGATTHGAITAEGLVAILAQDAAMVHNGPDSWNATSMMEVLATHGYDFAS